MARKERYLVGLDVGTSKVSAIVGEMMDDGTIDIIGIGLASELGLRPGDRLTVLTGTVSAPVRVTGSVGR